MPLLNALSSLTATPSALPLAQQFAAQPQGWRDLLGDYMGSAAQGALCDFVDGERACGKIVYPNDAFHALHLTAPEVVKVVILGQDPYHGEDRYSGVPEAHGLAFSVPDGVRIPPSLRNIYKELQAEYPQTPVNTGASGNLEHWARQGVLLLNTVLSVEKDNAASHAQLAKRLPHQAGWEAVTDRLLQGLAQQRCDGVVFILWGAHAQRKAEMLGVYDADSPHLILQGPHPSPLSAHRGFFGCGHFVQANAWLQEKGRAPIHWL